MPIHDVGYRSWSGKLTSTWSRWRTITDAGLATALKSRWVRRALLASWIPVIYLGTCFFGFERLIDQRDIDFREVGQQLLNQELSVQEIQNMATDQLAQEARARVLEQRFWFVPESDTLLAAFEEGDQRRMRHQVWSWMLAMFLRYPQGVVTLLIVGLVVPPLISRDVRSRAFLLYYSRPITRLEYLIGKIAIPASILLMITWVPATGLYMFGLMLSPDLSVIMDTWDLPFRAGLAAMFCIVPVCLLSLLFSSMTEESRFASFAWFTVWSLGAVVWSLIYGLNQAERMSDARHSGMVGEFSSNWSLVSLYSTIGRVQSWVFGLETDLGRVLPSLAVLVIVSVVSFVWLYRRVSAPVRV